MPERPAEMHGKRGLYDVVIDDTGEPLRGFFLLLPDAASLTAILKAVRVA